MKKLKVLIVTYYWPPSAGGGVQRWLKLSSHLPEFGIEPIIFTPENPAFSLKDDTLTREVADNLEVWKFPIWEPLKYFGKEGQPRQGQVLEKKKKGLLDTFLIWARATFFIPDPRVFWVRPSVRFLAPMIKSNNIDLVITTGPPHSMHLIGMNLQKKTGVKWVADFRDPWSQWDILDKLGVKGWARKRHSFLEQKVIKNCDLLITVSNAWAADFSRLGATKTFVLTNGYDEHSLESEKPTVPGGKFRLAHIGMLNEMRNPLVLWEVLSELCVENREFAAGLEIYLAGILSDQVITSIETFPELKGKLVVDGYLSHGSARRAMKTSTVQLLVMNDSGNAKGHIPGKFFEYLEAKRPILAIGDSSGDVAKIIEDTGAGACLGFNDKVGIRRELEKQFADFKTDRPFAPKHFDKYARRSLAMKLSNRLFEIFVDNNR
ncbi:MAG: glycosyltransferase [Imperialibacter sp.]|uniref:glycosyltransferase n=1 Tax=Imperialibacter sp. TaxID=2038411 RepID=UPI0032ED9932